MGEMTIKDGKPVQPVQYVQGDIMFLPVYMGSRREVERNRMDTDVVAYGEKTGHKHILSGGFLFSCGSDTMAFVEEGGGTVTHDDHPPRTLPPGQYKVVQQRFKDYKAEHKKEVSERKVVD
jgi:hypothetical protein